MFRHNLCQILGIKFLINAWLHRPGLGALGKTTNSRRASWSSSRNMRWRERPTLRLSRSKLWGLVWDGDIYIYIIYSGCHVKHGLSRGFWERQKKVDLLESFKCEKAWNKSILLAFAVTWHYGYVFKNKSMIFMKLQTFSGDSSYFTRKSQKLDGGL